MKPIHKKTPKNQQLFLKIISRINGAFKTVPGTIFTFAQQGIGLLTNWLKLLPSLSTVSQSLGQNKLLIFIFAKKIIKHLQRNCLVIFVCFLLLAFGGLTLAAIIPKTHSFEGELVVRELSFMYNGNKPKLLLKSILQLQTIEGQRQQNLTFTGKFKSSSQPELQGIKKLKIELPYDDSRWKIEPLNPKIISEIQLKELQLQPKTKVYGFYYDFSDNQLVFGLASTQPTLKPNYPLKPNYLEIYLGKQPLKVNLKNYKLPQLNLSSTEELEFILIPDNPSFRLDITNFNNFYLTTLPFAKTQYSSWFHGGLAVKNVQFSRLYKYRGKNFTDDLRVSTIIEGKVRMAEQEKSLQTNQSLEADSPGVQFLHYIDLAPSSEPKTSGIKVRLAGKTKSLKIGLDPKFPVTKIQASWLDGILPRDAIIALISFSAASFSYLLYWLIDRVSKNNTNP